MFKIDFDNIESVMNMLGAYNYRIDFNHGIVTYLFRND